MQLITSNKLNNTGFSDRICGEEQVKNKEEKEKPSNIKGSFTYLYLFNEVFEF